MAFVGFKDVNYAIANGVTLWFNGVLAKAGDDFASSDDKLYLLTPDGKKFTSVLQGSRTPKFSQGNTRADFDWSVWQPNKLELYTIILEDGETWTPDPEPVPVTAISQLDLDYAASNGLEIWYNDKLAAVGEGFKNPLDKLYVKPIRGKIIYVDGGLIGDFGQQRPIPKVSLDGKRADFNVNDWGGNLSLYKFTIESDAASALVSQDDIDYAYELGLSLMFNKRLAEVDDKLEFGDSLYLTITNGQIIKVYATNDPTGLVTTPPIITPNGKRADFDPIYWNGNLRQFTFQIELSSEQADTKGINDVYLIDPDIVRSVIKDRFTYLEGISGTTGSGVRNIGAYLLGLLAVPFPVKESFILTKDKPIKLGRFDTTYTGDYLKSDILQVIVGDITTPKKTNNLLDYKGKTAILHLPYCDSVALDLDYVIGETISIEYLINLYDGLTVINISSTKINGVIDIKYIDLDIKVPFANVDNNPPTGDPYNIGIGGDNGVRQAYIEILTNESVLADGFFTIPIIDETTINTCTGYIKVDDIRLVSSAKSDEKAMIINQLTSGVIINKGDNTVEPEPPINIPANVSIKGDITVGSTLTGSINDPNGVSSDVNYQWFDGTNIVGFNDTYTIKTSDIGKQLSLTVTFTDNDGYDEVAKSVKTSIVPPLPLINKPSKVTIQGIVEVDKTLSCTITDDNGLPDIVIYQWLADNKVVGTSDKYTLKLEDKGKLISVKVAFTDNDGFIETATSDKTTPVIHSIPWTPLEPSTPIEPEPEPELPTSIWYGLNDLTTFKGIDNSIITIVDGVMNVNSDKKSNTIGLQHLPEYHQTKTVLGKTYKMKFDVKGTRNSPSVPNGKQWTIFLRENTTTKEIWGKFEYTTEFVTKEFIFKSGFNITKGNFYIFGEANNIDTISFRNLSLVEVII